MPQINDATDYQNPSFQVHLFCGAEF